MKKLIVCAVLSVIGTGCSTTYQDYLKQVEAVNKQMYEVKKEQAKADEARFLALASVAKNSNDAATKTAAAMGIAMARSSSEGGGGSTFQPIIPQAPQNELLAFASIIVPSAAQFGGSWLNYSLGKVQSNNSTALGIAQSNNTRDTQLGSYSAIQGLGVAGVNGFVGITQQWAQAQRPSITVNGNGNGVQTGDGTQTVSTRNCSSGASGPAAAGGNGAAGGTGASSAGGTGAAGGSSGVTGVVNCN